MYRIEGLGREKEGELYVKVNSLNASDCVSEFDSC